MVELLRKAVLPLEETTNKLKNYWVYPTITLFLQRRTLIRQNCNFPLNFNLTLPFKMLFPAENKATVLYKTRIY